MSKPVSAFYKEVIRTTLQTWEHILGSNSWAKLPTLCRYLDWADHLLEAFDLLLDLNEHSVLDSAMFRSVCENTGRYTTCTLEDEDHQMFRALLLMLREKMTKIQDGKNDVLHISNLLRDLDSNFEEAMIRYVLPIM
eukprot:ANDGO_07257.mRNA.1 hypothetical protein